MVHLDPRSEAAIRRLHRAQVTSRIAGVRPSKPTVRSSGRPGRCHHRDLPVPGPANAAAGGVANEGRANDEPDETNRSAPLRYGTPPIAAGDLPPTFPSKVGGGPAQGASSSIGVVVELTVDAGRQHVRINRSSRVNIAAIDAFETTLQRRPKTERPLASAAVLCHRPGSIRRLRAGSRVGPPRSCQATCSRSSSRTTSSCRRAGVRGRSVRLAATARTPTTSRRPPGRAPARTRDRQEWSVRHVDEAAVTYSHRHDDRLRRLLTAGAAQEGLARHAVYHLGPPTGLGGGVWTAQAVLFGAAGAMVSNQWQASTSDSCRGGVWLNLGGGSVASIASTCSGEGRASSTRSTIFESSATRTTSSDGIGAGKSCTAASTRDHSRWTRYRQARRPNSDLAETPTGCGRTVSEWSSESGPTPCQHGGQAGHSWRTSPRGRRKCGVRESPSRGLQAPPQSCRPLPRTPWPRPAHSPTSSGPYRRCRFRTAGRFT
jgi:hypothetical protein